MSRQLRLPLSVAPKIISHEPDLVPVHKEAIIQALRWAWSQLVVREPQVLRTTDEETLTEKLQMLLNQRCDGVRLATWIKDFESVSRSEHQRTADGRLQKMPDLTFRPPAYTSVRNTTRWGWFVECKIVNGVKSVNDYHKKGVHRFTSGEYAAWMPSGAMLGYVRDGSTPIQALHVVLTGNAGFKHHRPGSTSDRSESAHERSRLSNPCVDVTLVHLWLATP
ncbi:hypothetical protein [Corallococcus sp. CA047B]|uniref:hypothetical protein n=1 Tax=Corallococcus sp. CA047B TaxID=2316729 RepID=UPI0011C455BD|nr:hypothetical protein [Corallococcus sp. CA047B]